MFLLIFDPPSSIVDSIFDCRLPGVVGITYIFLDILGLHSFIRGVGWIQETKHQSAKEIENRSDQQKQPEKGLREIIMELLPSVYYSTVAMATQVQSKSCH